ncbi:GbsR/MarR family transcriptional regulator [Actinoplanes sp. NPDC000266]
MESALVDDFGQYIGRAMGWPPMAGRMAGVLMMSEKPLGTAELQEILDASKGSVSEMTRLLITNGTVRRFKPPGSRQFVFEWRDDAWAGCLQHQRDQTAELLELSRRSMTQARTLDTVQRARVRQMHDYYVFMLEALDALLTRYQASR